MTPQNPQQEQISAVTGGAETVREQDKPHLLLAYLGILALIPLLSVTDSPFVKWHAKQGLVLCVAMTLVVGVAFVAWPFACLSMLVWLVLAAMCVLRAQRGERWRVPLVADLSEKF